MWSCERRYPGESDIPHPLRWEIAPLADGHQNASNARPSYPNWQRKRIQNPCSVSSNLTEGTTYKCSSKAYRSRYSTENTAKMQQNFRDSCIYPGGHQSMPDGVSALTRTHPLDHRPAQTPRIPENRLPHERTPRPLTVGGFAGTGGARRQLHGASFGLPPTPNPAPLDARRRRERPPAPAGAERRSARSP